MITELANLLDDFPGAANQTCCFTHILNLVVQSIVVQFDLPTAQADRILDDATKELLKLAGDIEDEDGIDAKFGEDGEGEDDDNNKGWLDERESMSEWQVEELDGCVQPVRRLLTKVRIRTLGL